MDKGTYKLLDSWRRETIREMKADFRDVGAAICTVQDEKADRRDRWLNRTLMMSLLAIGGSVLLLNYEAMVAEKKLVESKLAEFRGEMLTITENNVLITPDHGKHRYRINQVIRVEPAPPGGRFQTACTEYEVWPERSSKDTDDDDDKPVATFTIPGTRNGCVPK